ncbi:transcription termination/antitermination protein NusG [Enterobacteriaceae endosymbiont of Donacia dentata]|uniref:transcription termination/antitermination protein NusG n=1 Tax=Enterobacteriaceae endosymbiont of Donacia dentata TaxID=2675777 RepID=UPI0014495953|nr:transcription termination/antitermination protein NusG [Enterobacteriaceae endosymbiont of Donacia dentata]QJC32574.1 transcription termination/antitermination protein NusG [Enterobacteriaceae endosymbiont of Donacia dentata]
MYKSLKKKWYVIQARSGFENRIVESLKEYIKIHSMDDFFGKILVPTESIIEIRKGKKYKSDRKFFPGYILINMIMKELSWHLVRSIPKVLGFIGGTPDNPCPISEKEVNIIIGRLQKIGDKPRPKILFEPGEMIRVKDGPFSDFNGIVEEVDYEKSRLKVSVSIFGRSTPVDLNFCQIEKG